MIPSLLTIRDRRQVTLPKFFLDTNRLSVGNKVLVEMTNDALILRPTTQPTVDLLSKIQTIARKCGITETKLQTAGNKLRQKLVKAQYGL